MSHTPGPWRVGESYAPNYINELPTVRTESGDHIAYVYTEGTADACLIAAAPDLLAACKLALFNGDLYNSDAVVVMAAIAKAEGKQ